jgi:hypothetical protein
MGVLYTELAMLFAIGLDKDTQSLTVHDKALEETYASRLVLGVDQREAMLHQGVSRRASMS